ncbi:gliding motility-associated lipoprotein GldD [Dyadobacter jejuensis]|uniref:Gliding motility-associated lipoprotein GldD n=1 Tax=Dyadobacter jejuensis TaxID=1082580 RepID=A0A316AST8_9BACT|nr:gliding motility lipoprotein GldD [Dyadobacter jejuensis]PWJ60334.1 gliding motility-associated lipoprotein GldD [Dyadobacter jejuensis]
MKFTPTYFYTILWACLILVAGCGQQKEAYYAPKPKGYNRLNLPAHRYVKVDKKYPYQFDVSRWAQVLPDTFKTAGKDWIFIHYPDIDANIQITYKPLNGNPTLLHQYIDDSYKLAAKHQIRASSIQEQRVLSKTGKTAIIFKIEGPVPSPYQFYTTDSSRHFLRGAIYFPTAVKNDSLAPAIDFIQQDMVHLLNTLTWN